MKTWKKSDVETGHQQPFFSFGIKEKKETFFKSTKVRDHDVQIHADEYGPESRALSTQEDKLLQACGRNKVGDHRTLFNGCSLEDDTLTQQVIVLFQRCTNKDAEVFVRELLRQSQPKCSEPLPTPQVAYGCIGEFEQPIMTSTEVIDHSRSADPFAVAFDGGIVKGATLELCNLSKAIRENREQFEWHRSDADTGCATKEGKYAFVSPDYHLKNGYVSGDILLVRQRLGGDVSAPARLDLSLDDLSGPELRRLFTGDHVQIPNGLRDQVAQMFAREGQFISRTSTHNGPIETITTKRLGGVVLSPYADDRPTMIRWNKMELDSDGSYGFTLKAPPAQSPRDFAVEPGVKLTFFRADTVGTILEPGPILAGDQGDFYGHIKTRAFDDMIDKNKVVIIRVSDHNLLSGPQQEFALHLPTGDVMELPRGGVAWEQKYEPSKFSASFAKGSFSRPTITLGAGAVNPFDMVTAYVGKRNKLWNSNAPDHFTGFADGSGAIKLPVDTCLEVNDTLSLQTRPVDWATRPWNDGKVLMSKLADYVVRRNYEGQLELVPYR